MARTAPKDIRQQVLKDRGITSFKPEKGKQRRLKAVPRQVVDPKLKTPLMKYFELVKGRPIERILVSGSLSHVAKQLDNEVDVSTISKWIKRLRLRYTEDNLPTCEGCGREGPACSVGICYVLTEQGLYNLVMLKRKEMLGE